MLLTPEIRLPPADGWSAAEVRERWDLARFPRLAAFCRESGAAADCESRRVAAELAVSQGTDGQWRLDGRVQVVLDAVCQRCLEPLRLDVESDLGAALTGPAGDEEMLEWPAEGMTLAELLEDEIFLAMPRVPVHDDMSECGELVRRFSDPDAGASTGTSDDSGETRPFAGLRDLLSGADDRETND